MKEAHDSFLEEGVDVADDVVNTSSSPRLPGAKYPLLSRDENRVLAAKAAAGDPQAMDLVIRHNMGLIHSVARRYLWSHIPMEDLVQEGIIGFMVAMKRFDVERGIAVSTYAIWWVRQTIANHVLEQGRLISLSRGFQDKIRQILKAQEELLLAGMVPSDKAVACKLGVTEQGVVRTLRVLRQNTTLVSLDDQVSDQGNGKSRLQGDIIADSQAVSPEVAWMAKNQLAKFIQQVQDFGSLICSKIGSRAYQVFVYRYGISGDRTKHTLEAIGEKLGVTRERVRQIEREIWREKTSAIQRPGILEEEYFLRMLDSVSDLEELAQAAVDWEQVLISIEDLISAQRQSELAKIEAQQRLALASIKMLRVSIKEAATERDYRIFCARYGLELPKESCKELAITIGISAISIRQVINKLWRRIGGYSKRFNERNLLEWLEQTARLDEADATG